MAEGMSREEILNAVAGETMKSYIDDEGRPKNTAALQKTAETQSHLGLGGAETPAGFDKTLKTEIATEELTGYLGSLKRALAAESDEEAIELLMSAREEKKRLDVAYDNLQSAE